MVIEMVWEGTVVLQSILKPVEQVKEGRRLWECQTKATGKAMRKE